MSKNPFQNNFSELVRKRFSCRTFDKKEINEADKKKIKECLNNTESIFGNPIQFKFIRQKELRKENFFTTGTYGMIKGASTFLAGIMTKNTPYNWENFGYFLEKGVLLATDLNLNSCWIGGVFDRKTFARIINLKKNEIVPAVIALGYEAKKRVMRDKIVRWGSRGDQRKDPKDLFFLNSFNVPIDYPPMKDKKPLSKWRSNQIIPEIAEILENIRLAPSASNRQPWRILLEQRFQNKSKKSLKKNICIFHFYLSRDKLYRKLTPKVDLQRIDLGIALFHFEQSIYEKSFEFKPMDPEPTISEQPKNFEYICSFMVKI